MTKCSECGEPQDDNWPAKGGGYLCQGCWEKDCSSQWWDAMAAIDKLVNNCKCPSVCQCGTKEGALFVKESVTMFNLNTVKHTLNKGKYENNI